MTPAPPYDEDDAFGRSASPPAGDAERPLTRREAREAASRGGSAKDAAAPSADPAAGSTTDPHRDDFFDAWNSEPAVPSAEAPSAASPTSPLSAEERATEPSLAWTEVRDSRRSDPRRADDPLAPKRRRRIRGLVVFVVVIALLVAGGAFAYAQFKPQIAAVAEMFGGKQAAPDYSGSGSGSVDVTIVQGQNGSDIAKTLQQRGVTKTYSAFYDLLLSTKPDPVFQAGVWSLKKQMSAAAALEALQDRGNRLSNTAVITEGMGEATILPRLADATKVPLADLTAASADLASFGVPSEARNLDGFLFPATYQFDPGLSAHDVLKILVDRSFQAYDQAGVASADRFRVATLAALIQKEAGSTDDMPKVARVFQNRLDQGMLLQSDATVAYGAGVQRVFTTDAERADAGNAYNTYVHPGLPVGPIGNPGDAAIQAALNPEPGTWLFFSAVNLQTGETVFSTTEAEHEAAVKQLQQWCRASDANRAYCQ